MLQEVAAAGRRDPVHRRAAHSRRRRQGGRRNGRRRTCSSPRSPAASCIASARPPSTSIARTSRRTQRWRGASSRSSLTSHRSRRRSRSCAASRKSTSSITGVRITDSAIVAAATLSNRYITDRHLPDKAIDLIDEAASRIRMEIEFEAGRDRRARSPAHPAQDRAGGPQEGDGSRLQERSKKVEQEIADLERRSASSPHAGGRRRRSSARCSASRSSSIRRAASSRCAQRRGDLAPGRRAAYSVIPALEKNLAETPAQGQMLKQEVTHQNSPRWLPRWTGIPVDQDAGGRAREAHSYGG